MMLDTIENALGVLIWVCIIIGAAAIILAIFADVMHFGDFGGDVDVGGDADVSADIGGDADVSADVGGDADVSADVGGDVDANADVGGDAHAGSEGPAPIILLIGSYSLSLGIIGLGLFESLDLTSAISRIIRIIAILLIPFLTSYAAGKIWKRISKSEGIRVPATSDLIGRSATVAIKTDFKGGSVRVSLGDAGENQYPAKTFYPYQEFNRDDRVYIVDSRGGVLIVDENLDILKKEDKK